MDFADSQRMRVLASRGDGDKFWTLDIENWGGDLNNQDIRILDKSGELLFTIVGGTLEQASYIVSLNNMFVKMLLKEPK